MFLNKFSTTSWYYCDWFGTSLCSITFHHWQDFEYLRYQCWLGGGTYRRWWFRRNRNGSNSNRWLRRRTLSIRLMIITRKTKKKILSSRGWKMNYNYHIWDNISLKNICCRSSQIISLQHSAHRKCQYWWYRTNNKKYFKNTEWQRPWWKQK